MQVQHRLIVALAVAGLISSHALRLEAQNGCNPSQLHLDIHYTSATYAAVPSKAPVNGFFTTAQDADILLSGIDFNNTGGSPAVQPPTPHRVRRDSTGHDRYEQQPGAHLEHTTHLECPARRGARTAQFHDQQSGHRARSDELARQRVDWRRQALRHRHV